MLPYETPSRVMRRIEDAENEEMPSLPPLPSFEESTEDDDANSTRSTIPPFNEADTRESSFTRRSHSTPPQYLGSRSSRASSSVSFRDRYTGSITSRPNGLRDVRPVALDPSFDVSEIDFKDISFERKSPDPTENVPSYYPAEISLPGEPEDENLSITDALESVSLSSAPVAAQNPRESIASSSNDPRSESIYVSRRRPMPRLRDDFLNSPVSISTTSFQSGSRAPLSPPESPPRTHTSIEIVSLSDVQATPVPRARLNNSTRKAETSLGSSSMSVSRHSQGHNSFSEEGNSERLDHATPLPRFAQRFQTPLPESEDVVQHSPTQSQTGVSPDLLGLSIDESQVEDNLSSSSRVETDLQEPDTSHQERSPSPQASVVSEDITERRGSLPFNTPAPIRRSIAYPAVTPLDVYKSYARTLQPSTVGRMRVPPHTVNRNIQRRPSHPLSQVYTPTSAERDSFISTTSSHDLIHYARANASFDLATDGAGLGFNQVRLNVYMRGLLKKQSQDIADLNNELEAERALRPVDSPGPKVNVMDSLVKSLQEELAETKMERDLLQKESELAESELQQLRQRSEERSSQVQELQTAVDTAQADARRLEEEHAAKSKKLMDGAETIIDELQAKLTDAEEQILSLKARLAREGQEAERVRDAESLADAIREAKLKVEQDLVVATHELADCRDENATLKRTVSQHKERIDSLEKAFHEGEAVSKQLKANIELRAEEEEMRISEIEVLQMDLASTEGRARAVEGQLTKMESVLQESEDKIRDNEEDLRVLRRKMENLTKERDQAQAAVATLRSQATSASTRNFSSGSNATSASDASSASSTVSGRRTPIPLEEHERIVSDLEAQLEDAEREIGRLENAAKDSSASKAIKEAHALRIDTLERQNKDLEEKVSALRSALQSIPTGDTTPMKGAKGTPQPLHRVLAHLRTPKTPGGPLRDISWLQNTTTNASIDVGPYIARINELHGLLDVAGENLDHKVEELGGAGLTLVQLTDHLHAARERIGELEKTMKDSVRSEERVRKRLERCKCLKCGRRFDASGLVVLAGNTSLSTSDSVLDVSVEDPSKSREALQAALESVNNELSSLRSKWTVERQSLMGEKAVLRDTANRLNSEIKAETAKMEQERKQATQAAKRLHDEAERQKALLEIELERARKSIVSLETDLREERTKLRSLTSEQSRASQEKESIKSKLHRTETDIEDVKLDLQRVKKENRELEDELRRNTNADQKAERLSAKVANNQAVIDQLRSEREGLAAEHAELQKKFTQAIEQTESIRRELAKSQAAHDDRRHQLDLRVTEVEDLRLALQEQAVELRDAEKNKNRLANERAEVARTIATLESDLRRVRRDAESIGKDVAQLKSERAKLHAKSQSDKVVSERSQAQIRQMHERLIALQKKARSAEDAFANHVCAADEHALVSLRLAHNQECKGLMVQIRYLKSKFTRESAFRADLGYQKQFLLKTVGAFDKGDKNILSSIARIGFPIPAAPRKQKSLRAVAITMIFIRRAKNASEAWKVNTASKQAIASALQDVRRRRAMTSA